jgi:ATP-dependent DNA helicase RecG
MALPINLEQLLSGEVVEWERLEFKQNWNPEAVIHSVCAFANDLNNWGGGYLIVGIAEEEGHPILPPAGLLPEQADAIQKKLLQLCYQLEPNYFPVIEPEVYQDKLVLVIWAPGGDNRPYRAPVSLAKDHQGQKDYYVRHFANTVRAKEVDRQQLFDLAAKVPFDDRINRNAELSDLSLGLIREHLHEIRSKLADEAATMPFDELCRQMRIASGPPEYFKPLNIGLLMFNEHPEKFFPGAFIEVVIYAGETVKSFIEKQFLGPLPQQLRQALAFLQTQVLKEEVRKLPDQAEAQRFFNYPFSALEEALANAVYHRSYELPNTIEVSVRPSRIEILSFPGALPPVTSEQLRSSSRIVARNYRNRRVGDFLKELHLTEGRATGLPDIRTSMQTNGSSPPLFEMDADRLSFLTTLRVHPAYSDPESEARALRQAKLKRLLQDPPPDQ